jgi:putative acetyltransferase
MVGAAAVETRQAGPADAEDIAAAHRDSIRSIDPHYYPAAIVEAWQDGLTGDVYRRAMAAGEMFFIAVCSSGDESAVLGFASDYVVEGTTHCTSVYVRGSAARQGLGSALIRLAEAHAVAAGATCIQVEASLAGVEFYQSHGFVETGRGETRLMSGRPIDCVFMRKELSGPARD